MTDDFTFYTLGYGHSEADIAALQLRSKFPK